MLPWGTGLFITLSELEFIKKKSEEVLICIFKIYFLCACCEAFSLICRNNEQFWLLCMGKSTLLLTSSKYICCDSFLKPKIRENFQPLILHFYYPCASNKISWGQSTIFYWTDIIVKTILEVLLGQIADQNVDMVSFFKAWESCVSSSAKRKQKIT